MPDEERYLTVSELKDEIPHDRSAFGMDAGEWDEMLFRFLGGASDLIESEDYANTVFELTTATETFRGDDRLFNDRKDLVVEKRPIESVQSLSIDDTAIDVESELVVEETHLTLIGSEAPYYRFPDGLDQPIEVEWTYGYESVPDAVREAIIRLVRARVGRIHSDGVASESSGAGQSVSYRPPGAVQASVKGQIWQYRPESYFSGAQVI